jgi:hypothetical protein
MRCILAGLIAAGLQAGAATAQSRVVVVPAGTAVVVPPRGVALPASTQRSAPRARRAAPPLEASVASNSLGGGSGLAVPVLALLPLAAAVALSATLPGSGGGTSSPARTR